MVLYLMVLVIAWFLSFSPIGGESSRVYYTEEKFKIRTVTQFKVEKVYSSIQKLEKELLVHIIELSEPIVSKRYSEIKNRQNKGPPKKGPTHLASPRTKVGLFICQKNKCIVLISRYI